jgi:hypothetical protein
MAMSHANARAAIEFAVTMVVGVLVMMGAFLGLKLTLASLYGDDAPDGNAGARSGHVSATWLLHRRHVYCFLIMASRKVGSMSQNNHGWALNGLYL